MRLSHFFDVFCPGGHHNVLGLYHWRTILGACAAEEALKNWVFIFLCQLDFILI